MDCLLILLSLFQGVFSNIISAMTGFVYGYGYLALFILMVLESAALPIPSEIVLPLGGLLAAKGVLNVYLVFAVVLVAGFIGMAIDYYIAYFLGKEVVYKRLQQFHIKKEDLDAFDRWFEKNGGFTVFIARMLPEVRALVSFPAGFAFMPKKKFFAYSMVGTAIWDFSLITFGYYALNANNAYVVMISVAIFAIVLYTIFRLAMRHGKKQIKN